MRGGINRKNSPFSIKRFAVQYMFCKSHNQAVYFSWDQNSHFTLKFNLIHAEIHGKIRAQKLAFSGTCDVRTTTTGFFCDESKNC